jgi:hypothetical protein
MKKETLKVAMPITMWMASEFNCDLTMWIHGLLAIAHMGQSNLCYNRLASLTNYTKLLSSLDT